MKSLLLILLLCFSLAAQTPQEKIKTFKNNKRFDVRYDRFKDRTHITTGPFFIRDLSFQMSATFYFEGATQKEPVKTVWLLFDSTTSDWQFLDYRELFVIADSQRLELGQGVRSGKVNPSYSRYSRVTVSERLGFELPLATFEKIANAKTVDLRVGRYEITLKDEHLIAFRDLLSLQQ